MYTRILLLLMAFLVIQSCNSGKKGGLESELEIPDSILNQGALEISEDVMQDIVQNISSPVEMAALIKSLGVQFSSKYLAPTDDVEEITSSFQQALNLGIYGADLGYLNMYNKTNQVIDYISAIKFLADGIKVGQFFDFTTLKRLATAKSNLDSLMYVSVHSFNQMDKYLRTNKRSNISVLIITGVWIEGLYLATQVAKEKHHPNLSERIGEQKIILNDLMIILDNYKKDRQFNSLIKDLQTIKDEFKEVNIKYEVGEPEMIEQDGMLLIIQNEKSMVEITDEQLSSIIETTAKIRRKLLKI